MKKLMLPLFGLSGVCFLSGCGSMQGAFEAGLAFSIIAIVIVALFICSVRIAVKLINKMSFFIIEQY